MKTKLFSLLIFASSLLTSCSVLKTNTSKTMDIYGAGVLHRPVIVDLEVSETKVTGNAMLKGLLIDAVKQNAVTDALRKSGADVLVEPRFEIKCSRGYTSIAVIGFPATYKNFRSIKEEDIKLLNVGITQKAEVYETLNVQQKKNRRH